MSILTMLAQHADIAAHHISVAGTMVSDAALHGKHAVEHAGNDLVVLAQSTGDISVEQFKDRLKNVQQEEQLGWLANIGKYFIGIFQKFFSFGCIFKLLLTRDVEFGVMRFYKFFCFISICFI